MGRIRGKKENDKNGKGETRISGWIRMERKAVETRLLSIARHTYKRHHQVALSYSQSIEYVVAEAYHA